MNNINSNIFGNNLNMNINNIQTNFNGLDSKYKIIIFAVFIVFLVLLGFIGYIYWTNYKTNKVQSFQEETLLDGMYDCNNRKSPMVIDASKIPASTMGSEYSLNIWIYVAEAQNRDGYVLKRGPAAGKIISDCSPGIILKKDTNDMVIYFKKETSNAVDTVSTFTGDYTIEQFHSDEGRLVEGLENLEHFYGMNDELENNYIIEGFTDETVLTVEQLKVVLDELKDLKINFQFKNLVIPEQIKDTSKNNDIFDILKANPLLLVVYNKKNQQYSKIKVEIQKILDIADEKKFELSDKEISDLIMGVTIFKDEITRKTEIDGYIQTNIESKLTGHINTSASLYISEYLSDIAADDNNYKNIVSKAKQAYYDIESTITQAEITNINDGTKMNDKREEIIKKELIKLELNIREKTASTGSGTTEKKYNIPNLNEDEIKEMTDIIFILKKTGASTDLDKDERNTAIYNILFILEGLRNLINIMLGNDTSLPDDPNYNKYPNLELKIETRNIIVTQILGDVFTQFDFTYDTGSDAGKKKKSDIIELLIIRLDIVKSGGSLSGKDNGGGGGDDSFTEGNDITIHNIPLQRWTCLNISVFNQTVDIYIDGKLKGTENFRFSLKPPGPLPMTLGPVHEDGNDGSGFNGYLSRIKYSNRALNPGQVRQRYEEGPRITKGLWESFKSFFSSEEENVEE